MDIDTALLKMIHAEPQTGAAKLAFQLGMQEFWLKFQLDPTGMGVLS